MSPVAAIVAPWLYDLLDPSKINLMTKQRQFWIAYAVFAIVTIAWLEAAGELADIGIVEAAILTASFIVVGLVLRRFWREKWPSDEERDR
jgi:quinol-cytochrome oxidoreductase complex cytochrome b subunit